MNEAEARAVLLVRAVERESPEALPDAWLRDAARAAGPPDDLAAWLVARARFLVTKLPPELKAVGSSALPPRWLARGLPLAALGLGLASNLLGPERRIHAIWNPVTLLLLWNIAVYVGATALALRGRTAAVAEPPAASPVLWLDLPARIRDWLRPRRGGDTNRALAPTRVRARLLHDYARTCHSLLAARASRIFATAAVAFALGALGGMLLRGVAFEYRVSWSSTLVPEASQRVLLAKALFWPAALVLGPRFPDEGTLRLAAGPEGAPAAIWIAVFALCVLALVVLPRSAWILLARRSEARRARDLTLDLSDPSWSRLALPQPALPGGPLDPRILGWFVLDARACAVLASFESGLVAEDVAAEQGEPTWRARLTLRDLAARKCAWHAAWRAVVTRGFEAFPGAEPPRLLAPGDPALDPALAHVRASANRFAAELVLLELAAFEAYWPLEAAPRSGGSGESGWRATLGRLVAPQLRSAVRDAALRRAARELGLPSALGAELRVQLDRVGRELTAASRGVALGVAAGAAVGLLTLGLAAPVLALVAGKALGALGAAVALKAGLAALGGAALLAGGVGLAGGGGALVGGGSLLGVGVGAGAAADGPEPAARPSPESLLLSGAKIEVFLRAIIVGRHDDATAARDVLGQLRESAEALRAACAAAPEGAADRTALDKAVAALDTVLRRNEAWARAQGLLRASGG